MPSSLIPTAAHPLTPSFPTPQDSEAIPPNHQLATPRFLLSLLATSIYLSIPSVATQALSSILSTVGPTTVLPYLNFSLGKPLAPHNPSFDGPESAVGLENIALPIEDEEDNLDTNLEACKQHGPEDFSELLSEIAIKDDACHLSPTSSSDESISLDGIGQDDDDIVCHYGAVSNKIGEASACWLARWAVDMLSHETGQRQSVPVFSRKPTTNGESSTSSNVRSLPSLGPEIRVWSRGGLNAKWVAALVASDTLFVRNERHRYDFARSVVEMRRAEGVLPEEEQEWSTMFRTGIYYSNMVCSFFL